MGEPHYPIEAMISEISPLPSENEDDGEIFMTPSTGYSLKKKSQSQFSVRFAEGCMPLGATLRQNEELTNKLALCKAELQVAIYKEREARSLLPQEVRTIMDRFYTLQLESVELNEQLCRLADVEASLNMVKASLNVVTKERDGALRSLAELQLHKYKTEEYCERLVARLNERQENNASVEYEDFSLASTVVDPDVAELQQKLTEALEENLRLLEVNNALQRKVEHVFGGIHSPFFHHGQGDSAHSLSSGQSSSASSGLWNSVTPETVVSRQPHPHRTATRGPSTAIDSPSSVGNGLFGCTGGSSSSTNNFGCIIS